MYCRNCGEKLNSNAKFCPNCGTSLLIDENDRTKDISKSVDEKKEVILEDASNRYTIKLEAGAMAFNGERQQVGVFDIDGDNIVLTLYKRTTKTSPSSVHEFKKSNINQIKYKRAVYPALVSKIRAGIAIAFWVLAIMMFFFIPIAAIYSILVFIADIHPVIQIELRTGEKIKVYYNSKSDAEYVVKELLG